jgi:glutathione S-transferase
VLKFYHDDLRVSPYTFSISCALQELSVPHESISVSFRKGESLSSEFKEKSKTNLIPLIEEDGFSLSESLAILEYLSEKYLQKSVKTIFPEDLKERAQARMLLNWYRCGMKALRDERSSEIIFYPSERRRPNPLSADAKNEVSEWLDFLNSLVEDRDGFQRRGTLFSKWSIVDAETALMLERLIAAGDHLTPLWKEYAEHQWTRPSVLAFVTAHREPFRSYYI